MGECGGDEMMGSVGNYIMHNVVGLVSGGEVNCSVNVSGPDSNNTDNMEI